MGQLDKAAAKRRKAPGAPAAPRPFYCSFCFKAQHQVAVLIAGPGGIFICDECVALCSQYVAGREPKLPAYARVDQLQTEWLLLVLRPLDLSARGKGSQLQWVVDTLRARKVSWARIGKALGMSRQSAWERFSKPSEAGQPWRVYSQPLPRGADRPM
jgi:hypothetical protein